MLIDSTAAISIARYDDARAKEGLHHSQARALNRSIKSCMLVQTYEYGPVAHLVERLICNEEVSGSSPLGSTID